MLALEYSDLAALDLLSIADSESNTSVARASAILDGFDDAIDLLRLLPGIGHPHDDLARFPDLDVWHVGKYTLVFKADSTMLRIVRIVPGNSDFRNLTV